MPKRALFTLLISIATHVAVVVALDHQESEPRTIHMGSIQAPVSLSFSTVSQPRPPVEEPVVKEQPKPEPKVVQKPIEKARPVLEKKEPKTEPVKKKPKKVVEQPKPVEKKKPEVSQPTEPVMEQTVTEESQSPGLSNEPVMVTEPEIRDWVQPRYPKLAQRRNQQGVVMLDVIVDERGHPITIDILESSGFPVLDKAAIDAVKRWSFKPEQRNSRFVKSRVHIPVAFEIS
ncbi:energy transducer TonB [Endozoicomonas sp. SCSIO W0465]|uniref:energy transducer TonB n=1 Tax=Endozoicomonas sp. SCSIO W0465 TaxID=2918516 RepID=UPI0020755EFC|nr:energy transducer TonB [Endozoicomonas sp. SCSIO W0465]USE35805.1 energy transducer TonB [Endozoicomonas sp. SCSIO W0465]